MSSVELHDALYQNVSITEPLLGDLLSSKAMRRLEGVHQAGASFLVRPGRDGSRFEHSVGVMLIVRNMGGSLIEQAAALLHDVSHTVFSHVIDQVFANRAEVYHEQQFARVVTKSDVPEICRRYGVDASALLDSKRWPRLEQALPDICADRLDYTLRDLRQAGRISAPEVTDFLASLRFHRGDVVVTNVSAAVWFVRQYVTEVTELFFDPAEIFANGQLAEIIRYALGEGILHEDDLTLTDTEVLDRLRSAHRPEIDKRLDTLRMGIRVVEDNRHYECSAFPKARTVDPLVLTENDQVVRCSSLAPEILQLNEQVQSRAHRGIFVRIA